MTSAHGTEMEGQENEVWMEAVTTRANVLQLVRQMAFVTMRLSLVVDTAT